MAYQKSSNPVFSDKVFQKAGVQSSEGMMTIQGTVNKSFILFMALLVPGIWSFFNWELMGSGLIIGGFIGGLVLGIVTVSKPQWSPYTAPLYAAFQGVALGAISGIYGAAFDGIVFQAIMLTLAILGFMLFAYRTGLIKVTEKLRSGIIAATAAIMIVYMISFVLGFFGMQVPYLHSSGMIGIGISLVITGIAAFNLLLDFDYIDRAVHYGAPKYMEWMGAFGLMVTLVWLYLEVLRLLSKLRD
ncbi:Bax inhibitor-1/YccA family protein [bacterium SCSIO 12741]|nr:Bax inhibitor-1/YccA family protein [bacterium SCSIO 12741]